jgi:hypothetical protein
MIFDDDPGGQVSRNPVTISAVILPLAKDLLWAGKPVARLSAHR